MNRIGITLAVLMAFVLCIATAHASNTITNNVTTLKIVGLPPGANAPLQIQNPLGIYNIVNYPITNWTTVLTIPYNTAEMNTYHGQIPYQWMGAGTTLTYHGTTYTINESAGAGFNGFIMSNTLTYVLPFYAYFNQSAWNATQANELIAAGVNALTAMQIAHVSTTYNTVAYGTAKANGNYLSAGNVLNYATLTKQQSNASLNFVSSNVVSNQSYICINVTSQYYNGNLCKPGIYQLPIPELNGHFGLKFGGTATSTSITVTLQSSLIGSQKVQYNGIIQVGSNTIILSSNANSFSSSNTFTYYIGESLTITLDANGNSNYSAEDPSFTTPSGVVKWANVSLNNQQASAISAGTQIPISFNGLNYTTVFNGNLLNLEVFNGITGNVLYTQFLGNAANMQQKAGFNGVSNDTIMFVLPAQIAASTNAVNVVSIGFLAMGSSALNGNNVGAAPQIYCASGCPQSSYGQYDVGANVLSYYTNFVGGSTPSGWQTRGTVTINNGASLAGTDSPEINTTTKFTGTGNVVYSYGYLPAEATSAFYSLLGYVGSAVRAYPNAGWSVGARSVTQASCTSRTDVANGGSSITSCAASGWGIWGTQWTEGSTVYYYKNLTYTGNSIAGASSSGVSMAIGLTSCGDNGGTGCGGYSMSANWIGIAVAPPSQTYPTPVYGAVQAPPSAASTLTLSNTFIDQGQGILFTGTETGGTSTYSFAFNVYSSGGLLANQLYTGNTYASNTFFWKPAGNLYVGNTLFKANVVINGVNSISQPFGYNAALTTPSLTISNTPTIFTGQYELFTAAFTGGTSSYTYNYQVVNSVTLAVLGNYLTTNSYTSNTWFWQVPIGAVGQTFEANVVITDSASTAVTVNSPYNGIVTVNSGSPLETCAVNGNSIYNGGAVNSLFANSFISCTGTSVNNQITFNLYQNNNLIASSNTAVTSSPVWDNNNDIFVWNTIGNSNYNSNSLSFNINSIPYLMTSIGTNSVAYETFPENQSVNINITKAASNAVITLQENSIAFNSLQENIQATNQIYNVYYRIPLIGTNNLVWTANTNLMINLANGVTLNEGNLQSISQTELWNYIPVANGIVANIIEGQNQTIGLNVMDVFGLGLASATTSVQIGNQILGMATISQYQYLKNIFSFVNSNYNVIMPTNSLPVAITANIPVQLTFNSNSVWRNKTNTFTTYLPYFESCNLANTANAINYTWRYTPQLTIDTSNNVFVAGYYYIVKQTYVGNIINGTKAGFTPTATSNTYQTCMYPYWATFQTYGDLAYSAVGFAQSQHFIVNLTTSNVLNYTVLYLNNVSNATLYNIGVQNVQTQQLLSEIVQVWQRFPNSGQIRKVNEFLTPKYNTWQTTLTGAAQYQFYVINVTSGKLMTTTALIQAQSCGISPCTYLIPIGNSTVSSLQNVLNNIKYSCIGSANPANVETVSCSFQSLNGTAYSTQLRINKASQFVNVTQCIYNATGSSNTLTCTAPHINNTLYTYTLYVKVSYQNTVSFYPLATGNFGRQATLYGALGFFIAFMIVAALALIFITKSPSLTLIAVGLGVISSYFLKLFNATSLFVGAFILTIAIILFIINRRD